MKTVSVAVLNTSHFSFVATGATEHLAVATVIAAWRTHAAEMGVDPGGVTADDVNVLTGPVGQAFRDWSPYPRVAEPTARPDEHADCEPDDHTRDVADVDEQATTETGLMACNHCLLPAFYCGNTRRYYHLHPDDPDCFLILN